MKQFRNLSTCKQPATGVNKTGMCHVFKTGGVVAAADALGLRPWRRGTLLQINIVPVWYRVAYDGGGGSILADTMHTHTRVGGSGVATLTLLHSTLLPTTGSSYTYAHAHITTAAKDISRESSGGGGNNRGNKTL